MKTTDYYEQLGVARNASMQEIRQAYRRLAKKYHPDVNGGDPQAGARFKLIVEAYETLANEALRSAYDKKLAGMEQSASHKATSGRDTSRQGRVVTNPLDPVSMREQFEQFFGMAPKEKSSASQRRTGTGDSADSERNPLDTTAIFNQFFGFRKK